MDGTVRLVNGGSTNQGTIQICVNGIWGHVCANIIYDVSFDQTPPWSLSNARVVCRQLGYSTEGINMCIAG